MLNLLRLVTAAIVCISVCGLLAPAEASPLGRELYESSLKTRGLRNLRPRSSPQVCLPSTEIVKNGDFSDGLAGWQLDVTSACSSQECTGSVASGQFFSLVTSQHNGPYDYYSTTYLSQTLNACAGKTYQVSVFVTFEYGDPSGAYADILIDGSQIAFVRGPASGSSGATLSATFTATSSAPVLTMRLIVVDHTKMVFALSNIQVVQVA